MKTKQFIKVAKVDIGISDKDRAAIVQGLSGLLADSYTLYLTTRNFHWNVTGPMHRHPLCGHGTLVYGAQSVG